MVSASGELSIKQILTPMFHGVNRNRTCTGAKDENIDRKSTRLNSSHRCISYAVFCLKKKNQRSDSPIGVAVFDHLLWRPIGRPGLGRSPLAADLAWG